MELRHHGILGQKWGVRNGPPYPLSGGDYTPSQRKAISNKRKSGNSIYNKKHFDEVLKVDKTTLSTLSYDKDRNYFIAVSVIGAIVCIYDKLAAARGWRRVPERTLFFWALIGGGPGVYATMLIIRHKTLHHIFMLGIPAIMILQGAIIVGIYNILYMKGLL